jgi:flagellar biosynthesis protein FlhF
MRIKLISAPNMAEAMRRVRTQLGEEALILGHRRVADGVEITAALEPQAAAAGPAPQSGIERRLAGLRFGALDWAKPVMLVGTPGAGKTLTAAKLATRLVQQGDQPMVITADAQRAGAAEQLSAFTRILDINLIVAENPLTMARALAGQARAGQARAEQAARKAIIDMAGFNPFEAEQREILLTHAIAANANLVWVLAAGLDAEDASEMAGIFATLGARHMIPTRLDISKRLESVLRAAEAGGFILTDAGIGPGVADGLIPLDGPVLLSFLQATTRQLA